MQQILRVTYHEMIKHGLKFTMDDIAANLGMSKKTLYKIFRSKNDLVSAVVQSLIASIEEKESRILKADTPFKEKFKAFLLIELDDFPHPSSLLLRDIHLHHLKAAEILNQFNVNRALYLKNLLDDGIRQGLINPIPTAFVSDFISCIAKTIVRENLTENHTLSFRESLNISIDLVIRGLMVHPEK